MMLTLWDLIDPLLNKIVPPSRPALKAKGPTRPAAPKNQTFTTESTEGTEKGGVKGGEKSATRAGALRRGRRVKAAAASAAAAPASAERHLVAIANPPSAAMRAPVDAPARLRRGGGAGGGSASMQARYDAVVELMLSTYGVRVRKWRTSMSGVAWYVTYRDGRMQRLIESPRPRGPMSAAVFLHEIGHHAIGFDVYKPRCLEEYHAWRWSLEAMEQHGLNITDAVRLRMHRSLWYAVQKAKRRGIKSIPAELSPFLEKPARRRARR